MDRERRRKSFGSSTRQLPAWSSKMFLYMRASPLTNSRTAKHDSGTARANLLRTTLQACVSGH
jgi:hypothetical protein